MRHPYWLVALCVLLFGRCLSFPFLLFDDNVHIYENILYRDPTFAHLLEFWKRPYFGLYIPVTYTTWGLVTKVSRWFTPEFLPAAYRLLNVSFHIANVLLVRWFLVRLAFSPLAALTGAALFAVHPIQTESVVWVAGLKDILSTTFALLALRELELGLSPVRCGRAGVCFVLAMLTKPSASVFPLFAGAFLHFRGKITTRQLAALIGVGILFAFPVVFATRFLQPDARAEFITPLILRHFVAADALAFYLGKLILPYPLVLDYGRSPQEIFQSGLGYLTWMFPLALLLMVARLPDRRVRLAAVAFVVPLVPTLGLIPFRYQAFSTVADRYVYFAMFGPALLLATAMDRNWMSVRVASIGVSAWIAMTAMQTGVWSSSETCFRHNLAANPRSLIAHNNLGNVYERRGDWDLALYHYRRAIELKPDGLDLRFNSAGILIRRKEFGEAEKDLAFILARDPNYADAYYLRGIISLELGDPKSAVKNLTTAIELFDYREDYFNKLGVAYSALGDLNSAERSLQRCIEINPRLPEGHNNLGVVQLRRGELRQAKASFARAVSLNPQYREAQVNLARLATVTDRG